MNNNKHDTNTIVIGLMGAMFEEIDTVKTLLDPSTVKVHEMKHGNRTYVEGIVDKANYTCVDNNNHDNNTESKGTDGSKQIKLVIVHSR